MSEFDFSLSPLEEDVVDKMLRDGDPLMEGILNGPDVEWNSGNGGIVHGGSLSPASGPNSPNDPEYLDLLRDLQGDASGLTPFARIPVPNEPLSLDNMLSDSVVTRSQPSSPPPVEAGHTKAPLKLVLSQDQNRQLVQSLKEHASLIAKPRLLRPAKPIVTETAASQRSPVPKRRRMVSVPRSPSPAPSETDTIGSKANWGQSNSKQAIYAKQYRAANKTKMAEMEVTIKRLQTENGKLSGRVEALSGREKELMDEITYLRSVLQHDSQLATIIGGVQTSLNGRISIPFSAPSAPSAPSDPSSSPSKGGVEKKMTRATAKRRSGVAGSADLGASGICLHVQDGGVSVEFCNKCNARSRSDPF